MAAAVKELSYRTVDELIDSCKLDLTSYNQAGDIDPAMLIKIAQKVNYELGLRIHMQKETMLEINNGRTKLPADFYQLQLALLCSQYRNISTAPWNGDVWLEQVVSQTSGSTCDICQVTHEGTCPVVVDNPYINNKTRSVCNGETNIKVLQFCQASVYCYEHFERLYIQPSRTVAGFSPNIGFKGCRNHGQIVGNFLETSVDCGKVYLNYLGGLEDDNGALLVLDHPKINFYYEWAIKHTILELLYINGEENMQQRLKYAEDKMLEYRQQALSIANTPDYRQMIGIADTIRNMNYRRYYAPLDRWKGYLGYVSNVDYI